MKKKSFWKCGGGTLPIKWGYGYWTGKDKDLLCIYPNLNITIPKIDKFLSPICYNKTFAFCGFYLKKLLLDTLNNMRER